MIRGTKKFDDRSTFSIQTNNATETLLSKVLPKDSRGIPVGWLESCGPTSAINVIDSMGLDTKIKTPGGWSPQPEDVLFDWFSDQRNYPVMKLARSDIDPKDFLGNEVPQYYPDAVLAVFGVKAKYHESVGFTTISALVSGGEGAMICLKSPGHYLAVVAYDEATKELIYRDSWPGRTGKDGFNLRMNADEYNANTKKFAIVFTE
jgi:hypothetical protein